MLKTIGIIAILAIVVYLIVILVRVIKFIWMEDQNREGLWYIQDLETGEYFGPINNQEAAVNAASKYCDKTGHAFMYMSIFEIMKEKKKIPKATPIIYLSNKNALKDNIQTGNLDPLNPNT